ncbi:hypothetical protein GCM10009611_10210 [Arthrobacter roseus]
MESSAQSENQSDNREEETSAPLKKAPRARKKPVSKTATPDSTDTAEAAGEPGETDTAKPVRRRTTVVKKTAAKKSPPKKTAVKKVPKETEADTNPDSETQESMVQLAPNTESPVAQAESEDSVAPESGMSLLFQAPDLTAVQAAAARKSAAKIVAPDDSGSSAEDDAESGRGRRRSRRGRGRGKESTETETKDQEPTTASTASDGPEEQTVAEDAGSITSRRRRRRRRGEQDLELTGGGDDDPPNTVTRVRAPRQPAEAPVNNKVTSVKGSTRLEAKKQRRRDSRDSGRRRQVITEAEFLARRESVDRHMVVRQRDDRIQIGVLEDGVLAEHFVSRTQQDSLIGNVYVGKVQNVLPSMEAAFVDIGRGRNAVLYAGEVNWDAAGLDGQPRRIELALKSGDSVLVQVSKDPVGHKGARLTSQVSLPGRYLVYVPGGSMTGISRKLPDVERNRLKRILKDHLPANAGVIVRTAAEGASEDELMNDINRLRAQWENIEQKSTSTKTLAPELLYGEPDLTIKVVRDVFNEDFSRLVVSGEQAWDTIEAYVTYVAPDLVGRLEKWTSNEDIFTAHRIDDQIAKALERKVFLPSGGSLVIDRTEAMTVVDVNTGKFTGSGGNLEETVTKNNLEAAEEVVRQLRLRDIGGIIVIDFIDMVLEANRDLVLRRMVECLGRDRTKHQVAEVTTLGLVQMTRKRMGTGLLEVFGENCEHCAGRGVVTHDEPVEHKRGPAVSTDNHQQHQEEKQSRNERKRRGKQPKQQAEPQEALPAEPRTQDPERDARAEATRAALTSIAAATHHGHETSDEAGDETHVVTLNGESVVLPQSADSAKDQEASDGERLTLDSLTEAFDRHPAKGSGVVKEAAPQRTGRRRPRRVASSAQGAGDSVAITTVSEESSVPQGSGSRFTSTERVPEKTAEKDRPVVSAAEPLILGVGVPASEL